MNPSEIYELDDDALAGLRARTAALGGEGPVLVHLVRGFLDAGSTGQLAAQHLVEGLDLTRLVTFDVDELVDYRSRRPVMTFDVDHWDDYAAPELVVDVATDRDGVPFLLMHGSEPDLRWELWTSAMTGLVARLGVPLTVGMYGVPMGVPHTRPVSHTSHATRPELVTRAATWFGRVQVPASASSLLEYRLGQLGHDAIGLAVHVPHYLSQSPFPPATVAGLRAVEHHTGLDLGVDALEEEATETLEEVARQVEGSPEVTAVVQALEQQYDAFHNAEGRGSLLAEGTPLPSAEELGAQFERFLSQQQGEGPGA